METDHCEQKKNHASKNEQIVALMLREGLLKKSVTFSSGHFLQDKHDDQESIVVQIGLYDNKQHKFDFKFEANGAITVWVSPRPLSDYMLDKIISGTFPHDQVDAFSILEKSVVLMRETIKLYNEELRMKDNHQLLDAWSGLNPVVYECPPDIKEEIQEKSKPWWKLW